MKIKCFFGLHKWCYSNVCKSMSNGMNINTTKRVCENCNKTQVKRAVAHYYSLIEPNKEWTTILSDDELSKLKVKHNL